MSYQPFQRTALPAAALLWAGLCACASAQTSPSEAMNKEFPAGVSSLSAQGVEAAVTNGLFRARFADGVQMRYQFKGQYLYLDTSRCARDTGRWTAQDGQLCVEFRQFPSGCSEIRQEGEYLWLKRASTGEVIRLARE